MARNRAGPPRGLVFAGRYSLFFNWPREVEAVEWVSLSPLGTVFRRPINYALLPYTAVTCIERSYTRLYVLLRLECSKSMTASATRILDTVPGDTIRKNSPPTFYDSEAPLCNSNFRVFALPPSSVFLTNVKHVEKI